MEMKSCRTENHLENEENEYRYKIDILRSSVYGLRRVDG